MGTVVISIAVRITTAMLFALCIGAAIGILGMVEGRLRRSWMTLLTAMGVGFAAQVLDVLNAAGMQTATLGSAMRVLFATLLLIGIWQMARVFADCRRVGREK